MVFTRENVAPLAAELKVSDEQTLQELVESLNGAARWYHAMHNIGYNRSRSLARNRLHRLEKKAIELLNEVSDMDPHCRILLEHSFREGLDDQTRQWLIQGFSCQRRVDGLGAGLGLTTICSVVLRLRDAASQAAERIPKGGRPADHLLHRAVQDLVLLYEDFSGSKFAREKSPGRWTKHADWVAKAARMLTPKGAPEPTRSQLDTAMRYAARTQSHLTRQEVRQSIPWVYEDATD